MSKSNQTIPVAQFKAECLDLINSVHEQHISYIITKHGEPFAKLVPITEGTPTNYFGFMRDTASTSGDIASSLNLEWDVEK